MFYTQHISLGTEHVSSVPTHSATLGDGHQIGSWGLSDAFSRQGSPGCPPFRWSEGELKGQESREVGGELGEQKVKRRRFQEGKGASIRRCRRPEVEKTTTCSSQVAEGEVLRVRLCESKEREGRHGWGASCRRGAQQR